MLWPIPPAHPHGDRLYDRGVLPHPPAGGRPGKDRRRDSVRLAKLVRAVELTPVWVPGEGDEALRDLVRAREDAITDRLRARHCPSFCGTMT